jgi:hypothetical protein
MLDGMIPGLSSNLNPFSRVLLLLLPSHLPLLPEPDAEYLLAATCIHYG